MDRHVSTRPVAARTVRGAKGRWAVERDLFEGAAISHRERCGAVCSGAPGSGQFSSGGRAYDSSDPIPNFYRARCGSIVYLLRQVRMPPEGEGALAIPWRRQRKGWGSHDRSVPSYWDRVRTGGRLRLGAPRSVVRRWAPDLPVEYWCRLHAATPFWLILRSSGVSGRSLSARYE